NSFRDQLRAFNSAFENSSLSCSGPASASDAFTRKVDDSIDAAKRGRVDRPFFRIPIVWTAQHDNFIAGTVKQRLKGRSDEPRGARHRDLHSNILLRFFLFVAF